MHITINVGTPKFLRRSYHAVHDRFGKAGVLLAIVALIAALTGTALAVKGGLTSKQKNEVAAIAKKYAKAGPQGPQGLQGLLGPQGLQGLQGLAGTNGTNGTNGKTVTTAKLNPGQGGCKEGGASIEVEGSGSKTNVCNGNEGLEGHSVITGAEPVGPNCAHGGIYVEAESHPGTKEYVCNGEPGPVTEVLPAGFTLHGLFNYNHAILNQKGLGPGTTPGFELMHMAVSFPFLVENSSGEGPVFHYIRRIESEAESFNLPMMTVGPASGTGDLIGPASGTGDLVENSDQVTNLTGSGFAPGQQIEAEGIPPNTTIAALGTGTLELSNPATETKSAAALTGLASSQVKVSVTSGEFLSFNTRASNAGPRTTSLGQEVTGAGVPAEAMVTDVTQLGGDEVELTLSKTPTETTSADALTGNPSPILTTVQYSDGFPTPGETVSGPGIPPGTTITRLLQNNEYPNDPQFEISNLPTASAGSQAPATITVGLPPGCKGTLTSPAAEPGNFCLFLNDSSDGRTSLSRSRRCRRTGQPRLFPL